MNLNLLAKEICLREGKKKQVDIAQVKEVLKVTLEILKDETFLVQQDLESYLERLLRYANFVNVIFFRKGSLALPVVKKLKAKRKPKKK